PSKLQPALAGPFGERLDAPVVLVAAAIEHSALDAGRLGALRQLGANPLGLLHRVKSAQRLLGPVDGRDGAPAVVVDQLHGDAAVGAEHRDARTLGGAAHLGAHATATLEPTGWGSFHGHARLPTFRATYSPS